MSYSVGGIQFGDAVMDGDGVAPFGFAAQRISDITDVMFPAFPQDVCTDISIVLGTGVMSLPLLLKGMELLNKGQTSKLILTGGAVVNDLPETKHYAPLLEGTGLPMPQHGEKEADYMARFLRDKKVPESAYVIENKSKNWGEAFRSIVDMEEFGNALSVNIIGIIPTVPLMMLRKAEAAQFYPEPVVTTLTNVVPLPDVRANNWVLNETASQYVLAEFNKIDPANPNNYFAFGYCKDVNLKEEIAMANRLQRHPCPKVAQAPLPQNKR